jgi:hypothetical protein
MKGEIIIQNSEHTKSRKAPRALPPSGWKEVGQVSHFFPPFR